MTKELYIKFLNNRCTKEELKEVIQWLDSNANSDEGRKWGLENWNSFQIMKDDLSDEKFSVLFDKIQNRIDNNKTEETKRPRIIRSAVMKWMTRAAAILFIPLLSVLLYTLTDQKIFPKQYSKLAVDSMEIISPVGSRSVVELSDGTEVHLNYGSKLKYPQIFKGDTREVTLTGEAYFEVAHNPDKPFVVKTNSLIVKALGTKFNVLAYSDDEIIHTTLVEGKVVLEKKLPEGNTKSIGAMIPGQHVEYNINTGDIYSSSGNIEKYISWKDGKMIFEDTPITTIAKKLSRKYNAEIEIKDEIKDYYYTVTFLDEPLVQILDLMTIATPVSYKLLPRKKLPDGTFSKQKVIIEKK